MAIDSHLRGALIGCGNVARHHIDGWSRVPGATLTALCERDSKRLGKAVARVPGARHFLDAATMFEQGGPFDFVEICTGPESHRALVELAASHGTHVLCQKPVAFERDDLLAMIAACDAGGIRFMIHENWRFRPWNRALRAALNSGKIGTPLRLRISHADTRALRPDGFLEQPFLAKRTQLILLEMGCHLVDTARFLLGDVRAVTARAARLGGHPGEDVATVFLTFETGALGLLDLSWCAAPELARPEWALNATVVEGSAGTISVSMEGSLCFIALDGSDEFISLALPPPEEVYVDGYRATQAHFIKGLRHARPHETDGRDTLKTMDVVWAAYRSAAEERTIFL
jgi:D-apiose dehydrogenase